MLNNINFLVFRVTRGVLFALEICMAAGNPAMIVSGDVLHRIWRCLDVLLSA
jgi:hypothetical protein